jgi:hypothetical protein
MAPFFGESSLKSVAWSKRPRAGRGDRQAALDGLSHVDFSKFSPVAHAGHRTQS